MGMIERAANGLRKRQIEECNRALDEYEALLVADAERERGIAGADGYGHDEFDFSPEMKARIVTDAIRYTARWMFGEDEL